MMKAKNSIRRMTDAEAVTFSGQSEPWLRSHYCEWCNRSALGALTIGCGAHGLNCKPKTRPFNGASNDNT